MENKVKKLFKNVSTRHFRLQGDRTIWILYLILSLISLVEVYSASSRIIYDKNNLIPTLVKHILLLLSGATVVYVVHSISYKHIRWLGYIGFVVSLFLLVWVERFGVVINNAKRVMDIGFIRFQPSELTKLTLLIVVADLISRLNYYRDREKRYFWLILLSTGVAILLIGPSNLSTSILIVVVIYLMMFLGEVYWKRLLFLAVVGIATGVVGFLVLKYVPSENLPSALSNRGTTWVNRIETAFDKKDVEEIKKIKITDENRQPVYAQVAIARGGTFGVLPGNSKIRDLLPHAYNDYILAIIAEEMGLVGVVVIMILYLILLFRTGMIARYCTSTFPAILVTGAGLMIVVQASVNMFIGSGMFVSGQPLPIVSRGGTSILITSVYFGIILSVIRQIKAEERIRSVGEQQQSEVESSGDETVEVVEIDEI